MFLCERSNEKGNNKSTNTALLSFYYTIIQYIAKSAIGIFYDVRKAFDCVNHSKLLSKLDSNGVRGVANRRVASFLEERQQYVSLTQERKIPIYN